MSWLDDRWYQNALTALKATLDSSAELKAAMVQFLFDEGFYNTTKLTWEGAIARFNSCLNPSKGEFFKVTEIWALMKRFEQHALFLAIADDLGYEVRRKPSEERRQELQELLSDQMNALLSLLQGTQSELHRMDAGPHSTPVHPAIKERRAAFSLAESVDDSTGSTNRGF